MATMPAPTGTGTSPGSGPGSPATLVPTPSPGVGSGPGHPALKRSPALATPGRSRHLTSHLDPDFLWFLLTGCVFIFTCLVLYHADTPTWLLERIHPSSGILLLSFLSKLTDWTLSGTVEKAWSHIQWGPMLHKSGNFLNFLIVGSGVEALVKVLLPRWTGLSRNTTSGRGGSRSQLLSARILSFLK
jgi:hypothetical protein